MGKGIRADVPGLCFFAVLFFSPAALPRFIRLLPVASNSQREEYSWVEASSSKPVEGRTARALACSMSLPTIAEPARSAASSSMPI